MGSLAQIASLVSLTLLAMTSSEMAGDPVAEEMKCLQHKPNSQCNVILTYEPFGDLNCDQTIPMDFEADLKNEPRIAVVDAGGLKDFPAPVLIFMLDIDLDLGDVAEGYVHWMAKGQINKDGSISDILIDNEDQEYRPLNPPAGFKHRYQVFIFPFDADKTALPKPNTNTRLDKFCDFKQRNNLPQPLASTQFRYQDADKK